MLFSKLHENRILRDIYANPNFVRTEPNNFLLLLNIIKSFMRFRYFVHLYIL